MVLFLPAQFGKHFFLDFSFINGVRVDYLAPTFYFIDFISLFLILLNFKRLIKVFQTKKIIFLFLILALVSAFSLVPWISFYWMIRFVILLSIGTIFYKSKIISIERMVLAFATTGAVELFLSVMQIIKKSSVQGLFYFLGERYFSLSTPGIAKISINGIASLRAYGTFSHPNSMAGFYLFLYFFVLTLDDKKISFYLKIFSQLIFSLLIFVSFSKTALIVYLVFNLFYLLKKNWKSELCRPCVLARVMVLVIMSFVFLVPRGDSLTLYKRFSLNINAVKIIMQKPIIGVGLGNYLLAQKQFSSQFYDLLNQPVHNIFLLYFSETGLVLGLFIILIFTNELKNIIYRKPYLVMVLLATGVLDHYWLTLTQNFLLLFLIVL